MKEYRCICMYGNNRIIDRIICASDEKVAKESLKRQIAKEGIKDIISLYAKELK